ncbi:MAG: ribonuclease R [Lachnospiraceae bacterium]|nr:ribonuclease R [Lachnospiraceae bacterium]
MDKINMEEKKQQVYELICSELYVPMKLKEMAMFMQVPKERREELKEVLDALMTEGKVEVSSRGKYSKANENVLTGSYMGTSRGFGFVRIEGMEDVYISEDDAKGAMHSDTVQIMLKNGSQGKRQEGVVVKILARGMTEVVGTFERNKKFGFVKPDSQKFVKDIYIPLERSKGAVSGHKVVVGITDFGGKNRKPEGKVQEIIGHINDPGVDILSIIKGFQLPLEFPKEVMKYVETIPDEVSSADMAGRMDLRDWQMVTIDGEDAKDLDDAISITKEGEFYQLGVHIADVTNYVKENSVLDKEALKRGTSVYLVDRVIPMLPHRLSNGICSLNQGVDRLALSCMMEIDGKGTVRGHRIAETVVRIDRRMTYTSVNKILEDRDEKEIEEYREFVQMFELMAELAQVLRTKRKKRGSIDFDFPESKIILDEKGHPLEIKPYERNTATKIIEDFMLIANETIAQDYFWQELPFVFRTHDTPDLEKMVKLSTFINNFGYDIKLKQDDVIHPKELQKLLTKIEGSPEEVLISRLTLRSMKQARYTVDCTGHFGLAAQHYCHFTSPIRRYPDLQIHRIIKENLRGGLSEKRISHYERLLHEVSRHSSDMERRADEAERETDKLKKVEYMERFIGETFEGVISSITTWGMYVELPNTVEGMVHVTSLQDDYYYYDEEHYEMRAEHLPNVYKLGQKVTIKVVGADRLMRTVDFELFDEGVNDSGESRNEADSQ